MNEIYLKPRFTEAIEIFEGEDSYTTYRIDKSIRTDDEYDYDAELIDRLGALEEVLAKYDIRTVEELDKKLDIVRRQLWNR